jgi:hypothetical protein
LQGGRLWQKRAAADRDGRFVLAFDGAEDLAPLLRVKLIFRNLSSITREGIENRVEQITAVEAARDRGEVRPDQAAGRAQRWQRTHCALA